MRPSKTRFRRVNVYAARGLRTGGGLRHKSPAESITVFMELGRGRGVFALEPVEASAVYFISSSPVGVVTAGTRRRRFYLFRKVSPTKAGRARTRLRTGRRRDGRAGAWDEQRQ